MAQIIAEAEVLEALPEPAPIETEYQRLEIYDYAIASTLDSPDN
jgi:hypothetical protein